MCRPSEVLDVYCDMLFQHSQRKLFELVFEVYGVYLKAIPERH